MTEEQEPVEAYSFTFTYTYDQFVVFFYGGHVYLSGKEIPVGQCCVDVMNLEDAVLDEIDRRVGEFIPLARTLLIEKTDSAAALAQEKLNAVWDVVFSLPVYQDLKMDEACNYHTFQRLMAHREKWAEVQDPSSEGYEVYQGMLNGLADFADSVRRFRQQIRVMTEKYFEPLKRRNSCAYADAYSKFYAKMLAVGAWYFGEDFEQGFPMKVSFVPMLHPTEDGKMFVAEKAEFTA